MKPVRWAGLFGLGLLVAIAAAYWVRTPGYMDAEYYLTTAQRLAAGDGFTEPFLWNYLDDPDGLPHPSHQYWMPMATVVAAGAIELFGDSFKAAQMPFILFTALLPVLTAFLALRMHGDRRQAWRAGIFALVPGFYLPYFVTIDAFAVYALIGSAALFAMAEASRQGSGMHWLAVGILVGLAHLTRADGVIFLGIALLALLWSEGARGKALLCLMGGYLICMAPWWVHNILVTGSALSPGAGRTLWLLSYDELFSYPSDLLTPTRWWESGLLAIGQARLGALWTNLQRLIAENGLVFLGPFMVVGARRLWSRILVRLAAVYLGCLLFVMSFVFPFAGSYGGFFHSGAALLPILWALVPVGLDEAIDWYAKRRGWAGQQAASVLGAGAIGLAGLLTIGLMWDRAVGSVPERPKWEESFQNYSQVEDSLRALDPSPGVVAVNNPPGFHLVTGLEAVVVPNGSEETLLAVIQRYGAEWVVLDVNRPAGLAALYDGRSMVPWLKLVEVLDDPSGQPIQLLKVVLEEVEP
jgi:4-amino-4-deoxy-L-arabinose transferase-like glycosyltransferase